MVGTYHPNFSDKNQEEIAPFPVAYSIITVYIKSELRLPRHATTGTIAAVRANLVQEERIRPSEDRRKTHINDQKFGIMPGHWVEIWLFIAKEGKDRVEYEA